MALGYIYKDDNQNLGWEIVQWIKCLLCGCGDPSSDLRTDVKPAW